jgi:hypothetical protein
MIRLLVLLGSCIALYALDVQRQFVTATVSARLEWQLHGAASDWLVNDCQHTPKVVIAHENGHRWSLASFVSYDYAWQNDAHTVVGGPWLSWRFCPPRTGLYRWSALAPDSSEVVATGSFVASPTLRRHGPVRIHPHNPRLLATTDGNALITIGPNIAWANGPDRLKQMRGYLDRLADAGGTHFRLWCASWMGQIADQADCNRFRFEQADLLDRILAYANELGLYVTLVLDNHHDFHRGLAGPYGETPQERLDQFLVAPLHPAYRQRLDYLIARYAAWHHILAWELMNELDEGLRLDGYTLPHEERVIRAAIWQDAAAAHLRAHDSYGHLITSSCARPEDRELMFASALDLIQSHRYVPPMDQVESQDKDGISLLAGSLPQLLADPRPFCFSEVGYQGSNEENDGHAQDGEGVLLRQLAWAGLLLGGYGSGMNWWWDVYIDDKELWPAYTPLATATEHLDWNDPELLPIGLRSGISVHLLGWQSPHQALLWPHLVGNAWHYQTDQQARPYAGQLLRIGPLAANARYAVSWLSMTDTDIQPGGHLETDASGWTVLVLEHGQAEGIVHLRQLEQDQQ